MQLSHTEFKEYLRPTPLSLHEIHLEAVLPILDGDTVAVLLIREEGALTFAVDVIREEGALTFAVDVVTLAVGVPAESPPAPPGTNATGFVAPGTLTLPNLAASSMTCLAMVMPWSKR